MNRLDELLLAWEERRSRGDSATPEALCPDDPTLREELAAKIRLLEQFEQFFLNSEVPLVREPVEPPLPERVDKYVVARVLGRGGMGVVYLARDPDLGRDVAVKVVDPQRFALSEDAARRFAHEGRVLAQVAHPNIVAVFDSGTCDGQPFLVMEHVQGGNLDKGRARVRAGGPRAVAGLVEKVARAVHFAHAQDPPVLHRDLKPGNILLAADGEPKVADFGLAKLLEPDPPGEVVASPSADTTEVRSQVTVAAGTPAYMAPEQGSVIRARVSAATDVWALGVILHELLTGERPTPGLRPNPDAVAKAVPGRLGRRLAAVAARCLRESPAERFQTADDLADALAEATRPRWPKRLVILVGVLAICGVVWGAVDWSEVRYRQHTAGQNRQLARGEPLRSSCEAMALKAGGMSRIAGMMPVGLPSLST